MSRAVDWAAGCAAGAVLLAGCAGEPTGARTAPDEPVGDLRTAVVTRLEEQVGQTGHPITLAAVTAGRALTVVCPYADPASLPTPARQVVRDQGVDLTQDGRQWLVLHGEPAALVVLDRTLYDFCAPGARSGDVLEPRDQRFTAVRRADGAGWTLTPL